jgi:hypothetical protein
MEASQLLDCLRRIGDLRFSARTNRPTGWNGDGVGSVTVESPSAEVVIFRESGIWRPAGSGELRFSNVYRWSLAGPQTVRLEHLRFGLGQPVHLFELARESESVWSSVDPHQCRDDCYSARLQLQAEGVTLRWTVLGPRKCEDIEYTYRWRADG